MERGQEAGIEALGTTLKAPAGGPRQAPSSAGRERVVGMQQLDERVEAHQRRYDALVEDARCRRSARPGPERASRKRSTVTLISG